MASPIGENTYKGLAVPLYGESQILQRNSSNAIWTLVHSTANTGRFIMGRDQTGSTVLHDLSSLVSGTPVFDIDAEGGYRALSGTTVKVELDSSGLFNRVGTSLEEWNIDTSGVLHGMKQTVIGTTVGEAFQLQSSQSGFLISVPDNAGTSMKVLLPEGAPVGTWFDFWFSSQDDVGDVGIFSTVGSGDSILLTNFSSLLSSVDGIRPQSTLPQGITMKLIESTVWLAMPSGFHMTSANSTDLSVLDVDMGSWEAATTGA